MLAYAEIRYLHQLEYGELNSDVHFFRFWLEIPFLRKFGPKIQNCQFKLKSGTWAIQIMKIYNAELNGDFHFFSFLSRNTLFGQIWSKKWNCQFKLKFGTLSNSNIQNSKIMFTFSVLDRKYLSWVRLVQKIKIVSLSWNLVLRRIQICRIQCWCSLVLFLTGSTLFWQISSKNSKLLKVKFDI